MLGEVGQPEHVGRRCGAVTLDEVVADGRSRGLAGHLPALLRGRRPDRVLFADPVHPVLADLMAPVLQLVGEEAVAKGRVVVVQVEQRVREMRVVPVSPREWLRLPLVKGLASKAEHPAGQRNGETLVRQLSDQRELHFGRASLAK